MESADVVIVCISNNSISKEGYIQKEIKKVLDISDLKPEGTIFIVPLRLEDCNPPRRLKAKQYVDYFPKQEQEHAVRKLFISLKVRAESLAIEIWNFQPHLNDALLLPYSKSRYIERGEIETVRVILNHDKRGILFRGESGFGKTWLAFHLHRMVFPDIQDVKSFYISLGRLSDIYERDLRSEDEWSPKPQIQRPDAFCFELISWLCVKLGIKYSPSSSLTELATELVTGIQEHYSSRKMVFILDSAFEVDWSIVELLERMLFAPLIILPNTFFIMMGRGRPYPWVLPQFRIMETHTLGNFGISDFAKLPAIETLLQIIEGSLLIASFVLRKLEMEPINLIDEFINYSIQLVPPDHRADIRLSLDAICLLEGFRDEEMLEMLKCYQDTKDEEWDLTNLRGLRENLGRAGLLSWKDGGYYIEDSLRTALKKFMQFRKFNQWLRLNSSAYSLYQDYAKAYPRFKEFFENKAKSYGEVLEEYQSIQSSSEFSSL